ncbi:MAG: hypothetical protein COB54_03350 [Alphaproteobacteria bacterium]|nr:MAG: hypothetical protein COB54_03350 [Alphaproteobacteria bacterium]
MAIIELANMESTLAATVSKPTFPEIETADGVISRALSEVRNLCMDDSSGGTCGKPDNFKARKAVK